MQAERNPRVYAARRVASGLYIQPSNNGERWFVIARYMDGRDFGWEEGPKRAAYWAISRSVIGPHENVISTALDEAAVVARRDVSEIGQRLIVKSKREAIDDALLRGEDW